MQAMNWLNGENSMGIVSPSFKWRGAWGVASEKPGFFLFFVFCGSFSLVAFMF